jgi:hypothetical protein
MFIGPCPHRDRECPIGSNFCMFYLIKISFTLSELVYLMEMFSLLRLKRFFSYPECGHSRWMKPENLGYFFFKERGLVVAFRVLKLVIDI